jgi:small conductance mechanosensitive channel
MELFASITDIETYKTIYSIVWPWFLDHGIKILGIIIGAYIARRFGSTVVEKTIRKAIVGDSFLTKQAERKREDTLIQVANSTLKIVIWLVALLIIISEFGIAIAPIIAAAGIIGIAFGFGAQYLIRDMIAGLFILLENQYRIGDVVDLTGTSGEVEKISLRTTVIRDFNGTVYHIPNGEIKKAANKTKDFARVNLNIGISYDADIEKVIKVVNDIGAKMFQDKEWSEKLNGAPYFAKINDFADSAVEIRIKAEVKPKEQWGVAAELRKRIKVTFDKEGIEIPYPQRVIHQVK